MTYQKDLYSFEWNEEKNSSNNLKHSIWFEDVTEAFHDVNAKIFFDKFHSSEEERWILIGLLTNIVKPVVCIHQCLEEEKIIRIISARYSTKKEESFYYGR